MPRNAIATGMIDAVLPPEQIPDLLVASPAISTSRQPEATPPSEEAPELRSKDPGRAAEPLRPGLRLYKRGTLMRRIHRRMGLRGVERLDEYERLLRDDADEVKALASRT